MTDLESHLINEEPAKTFSISSEDLWYLKK